MCIVSRNEIQYGPVDKINKALDNVERECCVLPTRCIPGMLAIIDCHGENKQLLRWCVRQNLVKKMQDNVYAVNPKVMYNDSAADEDDIEYLYDKYIAL